MVHELDRLSQLQLTHDAPQVSTSAAETAAHREYPHEP
jgi:hypothetical protein